MSNDIQKTKVIAAMRFEKGHKEATRRRVVEIAAEKFRAEGIAAVGIAPLMAQAGLTHGGFYAHFDSKEDLVREAVAAAFDSSRLKWTAGLESLIRAYLRPSHRDHPGQGCVVAALTAEIAHRPDETRAAFAVRLDGFVAKIAALLPDTAPAAAREATATGILAVMIGALQMARAVPDEKRSETILESGIAAALSLAAGLEDAT
jgi:AcrR family transcriptional regulator